MQETIRYLALGGCLTLVFSAGVIWILLF